MIELSFKKFMFWCHMLVSVVYWFTKTSANFRQAEISESSGLTEDTYKP